MHLLTTPIKCEFSSAAATLSLSFSCLLTAAHSRKTFQLHARKIFLSVTVLLKVWPLQQAAAEHVLACDVNDEVGAAVTAMCMSSTLQWTLTATAVNKADAVGKPQKFGRKLVVK
jgi:hypothetical protein